LKLKRFIDIVFSLLGLVILSWLIILLWLIATINTKSNGLFIQKRVGRYGKLFNLIKIKTMKNNHRINSTVTTETDSRITRSGKILRKTKLDELPTLWNVFIGEMSLVGPRPDVPGYADNLTGKDRMILNMRPGITGLATIEFANEEILLAKVDNPVKYNDEIIYPRKVELNLYYINNWSLWLDFKIIIKTIYRLNY